MEFMRIVEGSLNFELDVLLWQDPLSFMTSKTEYFIALLILGLFTLTDCIKILCFYETSPYYADPSLFETHVEQTLGSKRRCDVPASYSSYPVNRFTISRTISALYNLFGQSSSRLGCTIRGRGPPWQPTPLDIAHQALLGALFCTPALAVYFSQSIAKRERVRVLCTVPAARAIAMWGLTAGLLESALAVNLYATGYARQAVESAGWCALSVATAAVATVARHLLAPFVAIEMLTLAWAAADSESNSDDAHIYCLAAGGAVFGAAALEIVRRRAGVRIRLAAGADRRLHEEAWDSREWAMPAAAARLRQVVARLEGACGIAAETVHVQQWDYRAGAKVAVMDRLYTQVIFACLSRLVVL